MENLAVTKVKFSRQLNIIFDKANKLQVEGHLVAADKVRKLHDHLTNHSLAEPIL